MKPKNWTNLSIC